MNIDRRPASGRRESNLKPALSASAEVKYFYAVFPTGFNVEGDEFKYLLAINHMYFAKLERESWRYWRLLGGHQRLGRMNRRLT